MKHGSWLVILIRLHGIMKRKKGMRSSNSLLLLFKQMLSDCGLEFLCYGYMMSWIGKRGRSTSRCCLDHTIENEDWHESFPHRSVQYLHKKRSNHDHVQVNILVKPIEAKKKIQKLISDCWIMRRLERLFWNASTRLSHLLPYPHFWKSKSPMGLSNPL